MTKHEQLRGGIYLLLSMFLLPTLFPYCVGLLLPDIDGTTLNFLYFSTNFLCVVAILWKFLCASLEQLGQRPVRLFVSVLLGLMSYFTLNYFVSGLIFQLRPDFFNVNDSSIAALAQQNYTLMAAGAVLLVPLVEECLYRGVVFSIFSGKSVALAYAVSTLLFSMVHVLSYIGRYDAVTLLLCALQYIPAGICLSWTYRKADNIFAPILVHATINAIGIFSVR